MSITSQILVTPEESSFVNTHSEPEPYTSVAHSRVSYDVISALPPIKLARTTQGPFRKWLFRVGAYEHQEVYDSERDAKESAERLLFTLFRDIADKHQQDALNRGNTTLAMRYAERRGYWQGRQEEKKLHQLAVGNALAALRYLT